MHNANSEGTTPRECSTKHEVRDIYIYIYTQSADSTVSSFVDSSAQHRGMRPNLIAMKNNIYIYMLHLLALLFPMHILRYGGMICLHVVAKCALVCHLPVGGPQPIPNMFDIGRWPPNVVRSAKRRSQVNWVFVLCSVHWV